ncbi:MAG: T9SS type A sorting domain-containing protein [Agriterribacter sp.]
MKHLYFFLTGLFFYTAGIAQSPIKNIAWEWVSGENVADSKGDYGIQGIEQKTNMPPPRSFPTGWTDNNGNLWMFGGQQGAPGEEVFFNDVWMYKPSQDVWVWMSGDNVYDQPSVYASKFFSFKNKPGSRRGALSWTDNDGHFWLFGGYGINDDGEKGRLNDLWEFVPEKGWIRIGGGASRRPFGIYGSFRKGSTENRPGGREGAMGWTDNEGNLWLFAGQGYGELVGEDYGYDGSGLLNDLWKFDTQQYIWTWMGGPKDINEIGHYTQKKLPSSDNQPGARAYTTGWKDSKGLFWFFGGNGYASQGNGLLNDMWTFNIQTLQWTWMGGEWLIDQPGKYGVLGNASYENYPGGRSGGVSWYDANGNVWLFGGLAINAQYKKAFLNDLWKFEPENDAWTWASGNNLISEFGTYGTKGVPDISNTPGARVVCLGWMDKSNTRWLFGGSGLASQSGGYLNDLWAINSVKPVTLSCPSSVVINNDSTHCAMVVNDIDPVTPKGTKIKTLLDGDTKWVGDGTASGQTFNKGTTTVLYALADNLQQSCTFTVTVEDHAKPVPVKKILSDITETCFVKVNDIPSAIDNCSGEIKGTTTDPLSYTEEGKYIIHWKYDDGNGNIAEQQQNVIVKKSGALSPVVSSLPDIVGECSVTVDTIPKATQDCGGLIDGKTTDPLVYNKQGTYIITWTYDDGKGNTAQQKQNVVVKDVTAPKPAVEALQDVVANCSITIKEIPVANDNCAGEIKGVTKDALAYDKEGDYTIHWTYEDGNGNKTEQQQKVKVKRSDVLSPLLELLPDVVGACSATVSDIPKASQNCGGIINGKTKDPLNYNQQGVYTITWIYDDGNGHTAKQLQRVIVKDTLPPVPAIKELRDISANCEITVEDIPVAKDNCTGLIKATTKDPLTYSQKGEYVITWLYADGNGNISTQQQKVIIKQSDEFAPVLTSLPDVTGECSATATEVPQASHSCGGFVKAKTTSPLTYNKQGTYTIVWVYDDGEGHTIEQTQKVIVKDDIAPVPEIASLPELEGGCTITVKNAPKATDNCAGEIKATTTDPLTYATAGEYIIHWVYNDGNGNTTTQQQKVILQPDGAALSPVVKSLPNIVAACSVTITDIPKASKQCGGFVQAKTTSRLTYTAQGEYSITWQYDDGNGNILKQIQKVIIKDSIPPVPVLKELTDITSECSITVSNIPEAIDNCGGKIKATTNDPLMYKKKGEYTIHWNFDDGHGNSITQIQKVIVQSLPGSLVPLMDQLPDIEGACTVAVLVKPKATDRCIGTITATTPDPLVYKQPGTYTIHWTYAGSNDTIMREQKVIVKSLSADIMVFPNPASNHFTISFKSCNLADRITYSVFDVLGRKIETNVVSANWPLTFGATYPAGAYFVQIKQKDETVIKKLIKL